MAIEEHRDPDPGPPPWPAEVVPIRRPTRVARTPVVERTHRIHWFAGRAHDVLDDVVGADGSRLVAMSELSATATRESLIELTRLQSRVEAMKARLLDHAEVIGAHAIDDPEQGPLTRPLPARSNAAWYAAAAHLPGPVATRQVRVAKRLEDCFHRTAQALAAGRLSQGHAEVIVTAVDALPACVGEAKRREAEAHLVAEAAKHDVVALRKIARYLIEVIDPQGADEILAKQLAAEEERAARKCFLSMRDDGHGTVQGRFAIPALDADMLAVALHAIASPKRADALARETNDAGETVAVPGPELLGQAFCDYIERYPAEHLPTSGGINATVVVTMELDTLLGGIKAATVDTGRKISDGEARRLASQSGVIPMVFDSQSVLVDMGRTVRLHTKSQRIALRMRHKTCTAEGCTVPAAYCHAHHKTPWSRGGKTSVKDGTLLCPAHHRDAHRPGYTTTYHGEVTRITKTVRRRQ